MLNHEDFLPSLAAVVAGTTTTTAATALGAIAVGVSRIGSSAGIVAAGSPGVARARGDRSAPIGTATVGSGRCIPVRHDEG